MTVLEVKNSYAESLITILRDKNTKTKEFREALYKISSLLVFTALSTLKGEEITIDTPVAPKVKSKILNKDITFIPILRAGLAMLQAAIETYPSSRIGFAGIYRDESTLKPVPYYMKFPVIKNGTYIILDPMLATGGTAFYLIKLLLEKGIDENNIIFTSIISAPEGIEKLSQFKKLKIVTGVIDEKLNDKGYIVPGLGDAGDRFCNTEYVEVFEKYEG